MLKNGLKSLLSFLRHPGLLIKFVLLWGGKNIYIGKNVRFNSIRNIYLSNNFRIYNNSNVIMIEEYAGVKLSPSLHIGKNVQIGDNFTCYCSDKLVIQDNCLIASGVMITTENHGTNPEIKESYAETALESKPIEIENGCWIGEKAMILPGVRIGERSIIAAGSVVTKPFPSYCIIAGVPAKIIKRYNMLTHRWESENI